MKHQLIYEYHNKIDYSCLNNLFFVCFPLFVAILEGRKKEKINVSRFLIGIITSIFLILLTAITFFQELSRFNKYQQFFKNKSYKIIEGIVTDFYVVDVNSKPERFKVNDEYFEINAFKMDDNCYKQTCANGGPICGNNEQVRIYFLPIENKPIIKLEITIFNQ